MGAAGTTRSGSTPRAAAALLGLVGLVATAACTASAPGSGGDPHVLTEGEGWQLAVVDAAEDADGPRLRLRAELDSGVRTQNVSDYADPPMLEEARVFEVTRDGDDRVLVAGPVDDDVAQVTVESTDGGQVLTTTRGAEATLDSAHGARWFWAELSDPQDPVTVTGSDEQGALLEQHTLSTR